MTKRTLLTFMKNVYLLFIFLLLLLFTLFVFFSFFYVSFFFSFLSSFQLLSHYGPFQLARNTLTFFFPLFFLFNFNTQQVLAHSIFLLEIHILSLRFPAVHSTRIFFRYYMHSLRLFHKQKAHWSPTFSFYIRYVWGQSL